MIDQIWIAFGIWVSGVGLLMITLFLSNRKSLSKKRLSTQAELSENQVLGEDCKRRAALAAVLLAQQQHTSTERREFPFPPGPIGRTGSSVSAWQTVTRANHLRRRERTR